MQRAMKDFEHIMVILKWLAARHILINFNAFPEKPKQEHMIILRALNEASMEVGPLLRATLTPEDYRDIVWGPACAFSFIGVKS
ncbi:hypothetical protein N7486_009839 [Penicillium sp. IBT 16267x]|nr:hypothetical protein N7486_009839 [Penicillium sp. IBT 16267x]